MVRILYIAKSIATSLNRFAAQYLTIYCIFRLKFVDPQSKWEYATENEAYITMEAQIVDEAKRSTHNENAFFNLPKTLKVATISHVLYLSKRSFLKLPLDKEIASLNENGLTDKWNEPYQLTAIQDNDENIPQKLNISQFFGIIKVCCGLLVVAFAIFVGEILSIYWPNMQTVFQNAQSRSVWQ